MLNLPASLDGEKTIVHQNYLLAPSIAAALQSAKRARWDRAAAFDHLYTFVCGDDLIEYAPSMGHLLVKNLHNATVYLGYRYWKTPGYKADAIEMLQGAGATVVLLK